MSDSKMNMSLDDIIKTTNPNKENGHKNKMMKNKVPFNPQGNQGNNGYKKFQNNKFANNKFQKFNSNGNSNKFASQGGYNKFDDNFASKKNQHFNVILNSILFYLKYSEILEAIKTTPQDPRMIIVGFWLAI